MTPPTDHSFATDDEIPWFSADGVGLELPDRCVGFVARYWPEGARDGAGELVIDPHTEDAAAEVAVCDAAAIAEAVRLILAPLLERMGPLGVGFGVGRGLPS
jgi:hypothetical protein